MPDPLPVPTTEELLTSVRRAIRSVTDGAQSVTLNGQSFAKADLGRLIDWEQTLMQRQSQEAAGGNGLSFSLSQFARL